VIQEPYVPVPGSIDIWYMPEPESVTVELTETAMLEAQAALLLTDIVPAGAVASNMIVSVTVVMLPLASLYWTRTVLVPSPVGRLMAEEAA